MDARPLPLRVILREIWLTLKAFCTRSMWRKVYKVDRMKEWGPKDGE